jgi:hypothetical protein
MTVDIYEHLHKRIAELEDERYRLARELAEARTGVLEERERCVELIGEASVWDRDDLIAHIRARPAP